MLYKSTTFQGRSRSPLYVRLKFRNINVVRTKSTLIRIVSRWGKTLVFMVWHPLSEFGKKTYPNLNESTVRGFRKRYESQIKEASKNKRSPKKVIINKLRGRPCLLGSKIDPLVQKYLKSTRYKGGIVNTTVAIATARSFSKKISAV